jgi:hypothetical protein
MSKIKGIVKSTTPFFNATTATWHVIITCMMNLRPEAILPMHDIELHVTLCNFLLFRHRAVYIVSICNLCTRQSSLRYKHMFLGASTCVVSDFLANSTPPCTCWRSFHQFKLWRVRCIEDSMRTIYARGHCAQIPKSCDCRSRVWWH